MLWLDFPPTGLSSMSTMSSGSEVRASSLRARQPLALLLTLLAHALPIFHTVARVSWSWHVSSKTRLAISRSDAAVSRDGGGRLRPCLAPANGALSLYHHVQRLALHSPSHAVLVQDAGGNKFASPVALPRLAAQR